MSTKVSVAVITESQILANQIKKHLKDRRIKISILDDVSKFSSRSALEKFQVLLLDVACTKFEFSEWVKSERKKNLRLPIALIGSTDESVVLSPSRLSKIGAQDYFNRSDVWRNTAQLIERFVQLARDKKRKVQSKKLARPHFILVGASTGGPEVLSILLKRMPPDSPPILVVQHIENKFAEDFYDNLAKTAGLKKTEPKNGILLQSGHIYMSTGAFHIGVSQIKQDFFLKTDFQKGKHNHIPSVDYLFNSCVSMNVPICAILLTGLGTDGARGLANLRKKGAFTMAQDEESSAVFSMPQEAIRLGAAAFVGDPEEIRQKINLLIS